MSENRLDKVIGEAFDKASIIFAAKTRDEEMVSVVRNLMDQDRLTVSFWCGRCAWATFLLSPVLFQN